MCVWVCQEYKQGTVTEGEVLQHYEYTVQWADYRHFKAVFTYS